MTKKEAIEKWEIIRAYGDGKTIQFFGASGEWFDVGEGFELPIEEKLRIKPPTKKVEPFKASKEFWKNINEEDD